MKSLIAMVALAAAVATAPAAYAAVAVPASTPQSGQPEKNPQKLIDISSDHAETHSANCTAIWTGAAEALQDTSRLRADVMIAHQEVEKGKPRPSAGSGAASATACGATISLEAKGNVYYASSDGRRVHGDNAIYDYASTTITITGDVTAVDGQNVMRGTKMVYNTQTGEGHMEGSAKGAGAKTRPRGVFYPKDSNDNPANAGQTGAAQTGKASDAKPKKKAAQ